MRALRLLFVVVAVGLLPGCVVSPGYGPGYDYGSGVVTPYYAPPVAVYRPAPIYRSYYGPRAYYGPRPYYGRPYAYGPRGGGYGRPYGRRHW